LVPRKKREGKRKTGGRNNQGKRTVRHRGGGVKQGRRKRVNGGREKGKGRVRGIQYDPIRTGRVARRKVREGERVGSERKTEYKYVLAVEGRRVGESIQYGEGLVGKGGATATATATATQQTLKERTRDGQHVAEKTVQHVAERTVAKKRVGQQTVAKKRVGQQTVAKKRVAQQTGAQQTVAKQVELGVQKGSTVRRGRREAGSKVCNVEVSPGEGGKYRRAAGGRGEVRVKMGGRVQIRRMGGKRREVSEDCTATVGRVSGEDHRKERRGKAGRKRRRGIRPTVRGEAMNPIDHPHGGRTRGGRAEVTPWTRRAKGKPTRKRGKPRGKGWVVSRT
jgi:ribosomal protein L2